MCGKKINHWYKNFLSDFTKEEDLRKYDTEDKNITEIVTTKRKVADIEKTLEANRGKQKSEYKTVYTVVYKSITQAKKVRVPVLVIENFGPRMCMDDKNIGDYGFTIISNLDTGKIAVMIESRKAKIVNEVLYKHVPFAILRSVKIMTKDLALGYERVKKESFINARSVADKFHVIKLGIQAISDLRIKYRQQELTEERIRREVHICNEAKNRDAAEKVGKIYRVQKLSSIRKQANGETILQILSASNRALSQFEEKWGSIMKKRIKILFILFPEIEKMYKMITDFRRIYNVKSFGTHVFKNAKTALERWFVAVGASNISELQNFASTVKHHKHEILAYFKTGDTNAYAESLNAKLQRFLRENFGIKSLDFFLWRIRQIFA